MAILKKLFQVQSSEFRVPSSEFRVTKTPNQEPGTWNSELDLLHASKICSRLFPFLIQPCKVLLLLRMNYFNSIIEFNRSF